MDFIQRYRIIESYANTSVVNICTEGNGNFAQKGDLLCEWVGVEYMYVCTYVHRHIKQ